MERRILFITTDQQRYDALGCNGGTVARTPVIDRLAADGIRYERAHPTSPVCMPSRATLATGTHVAHHGVWMNGVPLPVDAPGVAAVLAAAGYRTALFGKAHFEPYLDPFLRFEENRLGFEGRHGPHRGFEHMELATHTGAGFTHYARWLAARHPEAVATWYRVLDTDLEVNAAGGGDTGAPQVHINPVPREAYHTDWVADRAIRWLDGLGADDDWFCWVSFPDPHHPWDPPASERHRVPWRDLDLPEGYIADPVERERILETKPRHWRLWYEGRLVSNYEAPARWVPATLTPDQIREVNACTHISNELIDEAVGRILAAVEARGWGPTTDVIYTTDHGELQGDFGLLFKGPYHVDALVRLPLIWRPAPAAGVPPAVVTGAVSQLDLAPTFCAIAGLEVPGWMDGAPLPTADGQRRTEPVFTTWDSQLPDGTEVHIRSVFADGWLASRCLPGTVHDGTEGELYDCTSDPLQHHNRWDDPSARGVRDDLLAAMAEMLPDPTAGPLRFVEAPV